MPSTSAITGQTHSSIPSTPQKKAVDPLTIKTLNISQKTIKYLEKSLTTDDDAQKIKYFHKAIKRSTSKPEQQTNQTQKTAGVFKKSNSISDDTTDLLEQKLPDIVQKLQNQVNESLHSKASLVRSKERDEVIEGYLKLLTVLNPDSSVHYKAQLAQLYREVGKTQEAMTVVSESLKNKSKLPKNELGEVLFQKAVISLEKGNTKEAHKIFEAAKQHGISKKGLIDKKDYSNARSFNSLESLALRLAPLSVRQEYENNGVEALQKIKKIKETAKKNGEKNPKISDRLKKDARAFAEYCLGNKDYYNRLSKQIEALSKESRKIAKSDPRRKAELDEEKTFLQSLHEYVFNTVNLSKASQAIAKGEELRDKYHPENDKTTYEQLFEKANEISYPNMWENVEYYLGELDNNDLSQLYKKFAHSFSEYVRSIDPDIFSAGKYNKDFFSSIPSIYESFDILYREFIENLEKNIAANSSTDEGIKELGTELLQECRNILETNLKELHGICANFLEKKKDNTPVLTKKFTLDDLSTLNSLRILDRSPINALINEFVDDQHTPLFSIKQKIQQGVPILAILDKEILEHPTYESGDLSLEDENRSKAILRDEVYNYKAVFRKLFSLDFIGFGKIIIKMISKLPEKRERFDLRTFLTGKYTHASVTIKSKDGIGIFDVDMASKFDANFFEVLYPATQNTFRPNFEKIIKPEVFKSIWAKGTKKRSQAYDDNFTKKFANEVAKTYQEICEELLRENINSWRNLKFAKDKAMSSIYPTFGNKKRKEEDILSAPATTQGGNTESKEVFCSEFVSRFTYLAFKRLEDRLHKKYHVDKDVKILHDIFPPNLEFEKIHPKRLRNLMKPYFDKVKAPQIVDALIELPKKIR